MSWGNITRATRKVVSSACAESWSAMSLPLRVGMP